MCAVHWREGILEWCVATAPLYISIISHSPVLSMQLVTWLLSRPSAVFFLKCIGWGNGARAPVRLLSSKKSRLWLQRLMNSSQMPTETPFGVPSSPPFKHSAGYAFLSLQYLPLKGLSTQLERVVFIFLFPREIWLISSQTLIHL